MKRKPNALGAAVGIYLALAGLTGLALCVGVFAGLTVIAFKAVA